MPLLNLLNRVYSDRRDRYGYTILSRTRAIRAIKKCDDKLFRRLIDTDVLSVLVRDQVILPLRIVCGSQDEYVFIVQKKIRPLIVPSEWSPTMFVDAALLILRAEKVLNPYGMMVDDPHPWNILFDKGNPYLIDMGSFNVAGTGVHWSVKLDTDIWPAGNVFNTLFLNAVTLIAAGRGRYVRHALTDYNPISGSDTVLLSLKSPLIILSYLTTIFQSFILRLIWRLFAPFSLEYFKLKLKQAYVFVLRRYLLSLRESILGSKSSLGPSTRISVDTLNIIHVIFDQNPCKRFLVYGANRKIVDYMLNLSGSSDLLFLSPDEFFIDDLYRAPYDSLSAAIMDLRFPTPGSGPCNRWILPAIDRFRSDVGLYFFNLEELVIINCLTISELIHSAQNMSETSFIFFSKLSGNISISGRDYGQTSDEVIIATIEQNFDLFKVILNNDSEMLVVLGPGSLIFHSICK